MRKKEGSEAARAKLSAACRISTRANSNHARVRFDDGATERGDCRSSDGAGHTLLARLRGRECFMAAETRDSAIYCARILPACLRNCLRRAAAISGRGSARYYYRGAPAAALSRRRPSEHAPPGAADAPDASGPRILLSRASSSSSCVSLGPDAPFLPATRSGSKEQSKTCLPWS